MISLLLKRLETLLYEDVQESDPDNQPPAIQFEDTPLTRQRLNELLQQTPSIPGIKQNDPVQLS